MAIINVNGISGINSITAQSGSLNFYTAAGNTLSIGASVSGNITGNVTGNVNSTGVSTITTLNATSIVGVTTAGITTVYTNSFNGGPLGGSRNIIINGSMVVNQRGWTGAAGTSVSSSYTVDRFYIQHTHDGVVSAGQTTMNSTVGGNAYVDGFQSALILRVTTADSNLAGGYNSGQYQIVRQIVEGYNVQGIKKGTANAQPVTLSFWVRSSTIGTYICELYDIDNNRQVSQAYTINAANTWEKKTLTYSADTTGVFDNDNGSSLEINWWLAAGSSFTSGTLNTSWAGYTATNRAVGQVNLLATAGNDFFLTGVQLEVGDRATEFERRSFGDELRLCQRYYIKETVNFWHCDINGSNAASDLRAQINFPTTMRSAPTVTTTIAYKSGNTSTTLTTQYANKTGFVTYPSQDENNGVVLLGEYQATIEL